MRPLRTETSGWIPRPRDTGIFVREEALSLSFFIPRRIEETIRNTSILDQDVFSPCDRIDSNDNLRTRAREKRIQAIVFLQTRASYVRSRAEKPSKREKRKRKREEVAIPCIYTRNIVRCFSGCAWTWGKGGRW